jgi:hypothetical protein
MQATKFIDRWSSRGANLLTFWPLAPAGVIGVMLGYFSTGIAWINQFGAFGWLAVGVLGFVLTAVGMLAVALAWEKWATAKATIKWQKDVDQFNPLDTEFTRRRMRVQELAHPITRRIIGKRIIECELFGPATIVLRGRTRLDDSTFLNCDFMILKDDAITHNYPIMFIDCTILETEISNCTVLINQELYDSTFASMGLASITYEKPKDNDDSR